MIDQALFAATVTIPMADRMTEADNWRRQRELRRHAAQHSPRTTWWRRWTNTRGTRRVLPDEVRIPEPRTAGSSLAGPAEKSDLPVGA